MNWLMALVAFAAFMAMLASLVTVGVEGWHKLFGLRRSGLEEMLRAIHDNVLRDPLASSFSVRLGASSSAPAFAKRMTENPGYAGHGRWWWPRNWPLLNGFFFQPRLESLSKLQFAEQLGQTDLGRQAALSMPEGERRAFLDRAVREFDRYGEVQSDYFRRRAKAVSGLLAFGLVAVANINAFQVYRAMALDPALTERTQSAFASQDAAAFASQLERTRTEISRLQFAIDQGATDPANLADMRTALAATQAQAAEMQLAVTSAKSALSALEDTGLPIGPNRFPYCIVGKGETSPDPMCGQPVGAALPGHAFAAIGAPVTVQHAAIRVASFDGLFWFMQILATAGLLGLGAPFWFSVARSVSAISGRRQSAAAVEAQQPQSPLSRPSAPTILELDDALLRTAGAPVAPPRGASYASAPAASTASAGGGAGAGSPGMRQVLR